MLVSDSDEAVLQSNLRPCVSGSWCAWPAPGWTRLGQFLRLARVSSHTERREEQAPAILCGSFEECLGPRRGQPASTARARKVNIELQREHAGDRVTLSLSRYHRDSLRSLADT